MRRAAFAALLLALCAPAWSAPAPGAAALQQIDVSLTTFDPGIPDDEEERVAKRIFPEVRRAEASYLPFVLRQALVQSDHWGVVRVLPEADPSAELLLSGTILRSDGIHLEIALRALDSTGREWLNKTYTATTTERDYTATRDRSKPLFAALFQQVEQELAQQGATLAAADLARIEQVSQLRYAQALVPEAFAGYLAQDGAGRWDVRRLPAENDPMTARIARVREHEYLFVDTVDEQYAALYDQMTPSYDMWRKFSREQILYQDTHEEFLKGRNKRKHDEYETMRRAWDAYKWSKMEEQEVALLAKGFHNELSPTMLTLDNQLISLQGSLHERYQEWRRILQKMFLLETGAPAGAG